MFQGWYANAFRFGSQLWEFRFGSRCCTSIHTFLFIFSVWALGLAVRFRAVFLKVSGNPLLGSDFEWQGGEKTKGATRGRNNIKGAKMLNH